MSVALPLPVSLIATLLPLLEQQQRLRAAVRDRHEIIACDDWGSLLHACDERPIRTAVVDLYANGSAALQQLRHLRTHQPRLVIVLYVAPVAGRMPGIFEASKAGADVLVILGENDSPRMLLAVLEQADASGLSGLISSTLSSTTDSLVREALLLATARAHERVTSATLARLLAVSPSDLRRRLAAAGFPPTMRLVTWARLIAAAHVLEDERWTADRIASSLRFASASAFRNICQRYVHATPTEIRSRGGASYVLRSLMRQVRHGGSAPEARSSHRAPAVIF